MGLKLHDLLGKRYDLHLADGRVWDVRVTEVDPASGLTVAKVLNPAECRQSIVLAKALAGIADGSLVEAVRP